MDSEATIRAISRLDIDIQCAVAKVTIEENRDGGRSGDHHARSLSANSGAPQTRS